MSSNIKNIIFIRTLTNSYWCLVRVLGSEVKDSDLSSLGGGGPLLPIFGWPENDSNGGGRRRRKRNKERKRKDFEMWVLRVGKGWVPVGYI